MPRKKKIDEEIPEAPIAERKRKKMGRPKGSKNAKTPGHSKYIQWNNKIDIMTYEEIIDVREKFFEHLANGFPITSFHYKMSYKTLQRLIKQRPDIFDEESMEMIHSKRYHTMIDIGMRQANGELHKGNAASWKLLMYNMFGWKEKTESQTNIDIGSRFKQAVGKQNATSMDELEEQ